MFSQVIAGIQISIKGITTMAYKETFGTRTNLSAFGTGFATLERTNLNNFNSFSLSFILNKFLQLVEVPSMQPEIKSFSFSNISYSFEVLYHNNSCLAVFHNLLTYQMVPVSHKPFLTTTKLLQKALRASCAFSLQFISQSLEFQSFELNLSCIEKLLVGSDSYIVYSNINAENLRIQTFSINLFGKSKQEEASSFFVNLQQTFSDIPVEILFVTFWNGNLKILPSLDSCQTQDIIFKGSRTRKVISYTYSVDSWLTFSPFNHSTSLFNTSYSQLSLQSSFTQRFIDKRVKLNIITDFPLPSLINTELQSLSIEFESFDYLRSCSDFDFGCCSNLHGNIEDKLLYISHVNMSSDQWPTRKTFIKIEFLDGKISECPVRFSGNVEKIPKPENLRKKREGGAIPLTSGDVSILVAFI